VVRCSDDLHEGLVIGGGEEATRGYAESYA
jgi:hypothetical protein